MKIYSRRKALLNTVNPPVGYEWADYIENTSNAYIDTGCHPDGTTQVEMVMMNTSIPRFSGIIGVNRDGAPMWGIDQHASSGTEARFYYGSSYRSISTIAIGSKTTLIIDKNVIKRNGTSYTISGTWSGGAKAQPMYVFRSYFGGESCAYMRLYSLKITIGGVLLRDYRPIKRLSDNKYGLWDKVEGKFYTSESSSNFVGGGKFTLIMNAAPFQAERRAA